MNEPEKAEHIQSTIKAKEQKQSEQLIIGPNPKKMLKCNIYSQCILVEYNDLILDNAPSASNYELSYMHRDIVHFALTSSIQNIVVTASIDGHIKFWRKSFILIEFIRNFKAHTGYISAVVFNRSHDLLASCGVDKTLKIFDVLNCDLRTVLKLDFSPMACDFFPQKEFDWQLLAVSEEKTGRIMVIDPNYQNKNSQIESDTEVIASISTQSTNQKPQNQQNAEKPSELEYLIRTLSFHKHPIRSIKTDWANQICFSIDERGFLEVWNPFTFDFPTHMKYKCKIQTEFLKLLSSNSVPICLNISCKSKYIAVVLKDHSIWVFNVETGKQTACIREQLSEVSDIQGDPHHLLHLQENEFERKMHLEKELDTAKEVLFNPNVEFDETEEFLIYTSFYGLKFYCLKTKNVERIIGTKEHERFLRVSLFQGEAMRNPAGSSTAQGQRKMADPMLVCSAFRKNRFYMFSRRQPNISEPGIVRDIINERPNKEQIMIQKLREEATKESEVILQTTLGDIHLELFVDECPKACENLIKLSKKNYYDSMIFHRVIKGFMVQTGCPKGDGTGGNSIWGDYFEDQLCPQIHRFDKPYMLAMANRGPNTNGSQFFITVVPTPWLDNKHTVFGRVSKGVSTVIEINKLKTDKGDKPLVPVKIMSTKVVKRGS